MIYDHIHSYLTKISLDNVHGELSKINDSFKEYYRPEEDKKNQITFF